MSERQLRDELEHLQAEARRLRRALAAGPSPGFLQHQERLGGECARLRRVVRETESQAATLESNVDTLDAAFAQATPVMWRQRGWSRLSWMCVALPLGLLAALLLALSGRGSSASATFMALAGWAGGWLGLVAGRRWSRLRRSAAQRDDADRA